MKYLLMVLMLSGCGCGVSVGDKVVNIKSNEKGDILAVRSWGAWSGQCRVWVSYDNPEIISYWYYGFNFKVIDNG